MTLFVSADSLRESFSSAMSNLYRTEVPAYGTLIDLVLSINRTTLDDKPERLAATHDDGELARLSAERHGAIRLGTANELATLRRMLAVFGMYPVGYYDLSVAGIPVHSTAFRPVHEASLANNAFRLFTSLLRLELIEDTQLRQTAQRILAERRIFTAPALQLLTTFEHQGGLTAEQGQAFIEQLINTFRWHRHATVSHSLYRQLHASHRLVADVVSFKGPHINHLTPRTLDIDAVQTAMPKHGITPKAIIEGPPRRQCPLLLRQTAFKALEEPVMFRNDKSNGDAHWIKGHHTARFGEIEQRGIALTPAGQARYDRALAMARAQITPATDGSNANEYQQALTTAFADFPDSWEMLRSQRLGYFRYHVTGKRLTTIEAVHTQTLRKLNNLNSVEPLFDELLAHGIVALEPVLYDDFLPVSAAGIFQSNLGNSPVQADRKRIVDSASQQRFEHDLGCPVLNAFELYQTIETASQQACIKTVFEAS